jgi:hypothetical protein
VDENLDVLDSGGRRKIVAPAPGVQEIDPESRE